MGSAVLDCGRSAYIHEFCFQAARRSDMDCVELQVCLFANRQEWHFLSPNIQIIAVPSCKSVDFLMFVNSGLMVRNVEICAVLTSNEIEILSVLSSNEIDCLMLRNRVIRQGNDQKCAVQS